MYDAVGATILDELTSINVHLLRVPETARAAVAQALARHPQVKFVEENALAQGMYIPNDPYYGNEWHLARIAAPTGWDISTGSTQIAVAVIDSGIDPAHPDLAGKLVPGFNFLNSTLDTRDVLGHGTAVAGTAGAIAGNQRGVAGVALQNPLLPLVVLNANNYATYANMAAAIMYAADHGVRVINISIGGSSYSSTLQGAVDYAWNKGSIIVASAGNNANSTPMYPAALARVVAVSATDSADALASFSSYGTWIDLAAPGVSILTTTNGGGYGYWYGTSFASPLVAGVAALVLSVNPALSNTQVVELLRQYSDDKGATGYDALFGYGRINVYQTLVAAQTTSASSNVPPPGSDTAAPSVRIISPANNSTVARTLQIAVSATDNVGVMRVELYIDGALYGTSTTAPYAFAWNTRKASSGAHRLEARAYDRQGNIGLAAPVTVYK
ncbi:MAG: S8 family serine peptidase [Candidatus Tectimicrobiota bacterium]